MKMERATDTVLARQAELQGKSAAARIDLRTAALLVAVERVAHVAQERGIWP
jgi:glutamate dehydrogenase/leucine dehydrogenase